MLIENKSLVTKYDKLKNEGQAWRRDLARDVVVNFIRGYKISETNWKGLKEEGFFF